jgi:hypothetical protein
MFANQIINSSKIGRGLFNLHQKINSGCLAITLSESFACQHYALIKDSYLVIKAGLVVGKALVIIPQFSLTMTGHPPRYSN